MTEQFCIVFGWCGPLGELLARLEQADADRAKDGGFIIRGEILARVGDQYSNSKIVLVPTAAQCYFAGRPMPLVDLLEESRK